MSERQAHMSVEELNRQPVVLAACEDYTQEHAAAALTACIEGMGGLGWAKAGMTVAIKANLVSGMAPDKAATTNPVLVRELARMLHERGCRVIIGDSPGGIYTPVYVGSVYRGSGMDQAAGEYAELNQDFSVTNAVFPEAVSIRSFTYTGWLDKADAIINFAKFKTHAMMSMSCSVKNLFGTIPGTTKPEYHMRFPDTMAFANLMVDLNRYFKPVFNFVDAVEGMEGNGPTAGTPRHLGLLLASRSPYNLDMICADLMGLDRKDVPTIEAALQRGLGAKEVSEINVIGHTEAFHKHEWNLVTNRKTTTFGGGPLGALISPVGRWIFASRPQVHGSACIGCKKCFNICPAHAITMVDKKPSIDRKKCIHCFCCQEFCPVGAMRVHHNPISKLIGRINTGRNS